MGLSYVGGNTASATTVTIPAGHQAGDTMFIFAFNSASTTAITVPTGWATLAAPAGANTCSMVLATKTAGTSSETSGTWTTATQVSCLVYRGVIGAAVTTNSGTGTSVSYAAIPLAVYGGSWQVGFAGHRTATDMNVAPTGLILKTGSVTKIAGSDTDRPAVANWPLTSTTVNASSGWFTATLEIKPRTTVMNNYQGVHAGDGLSTGEKIR